MRKTLLFALVLLSALVVQESQAGWFSKAIKSVVSKVKSFVDNNRGLIGFAASVIGKRKRSVDDVALGNSTAMQQLQTKLDAACPALGIKPTDTISKQVILEAFAQSDDSNDGSLDDDELDELNKILLAYKECINVESRKR